MVGTVTKNVGRVVAAWSTFWIGVIAALIVLATAGWKIGLIVFAAFLLLTLIQVVLLVKRGASAAGKFMQEVLSEARANTPHGN